VSLSGRERKKKQEMLLEDETKIAITAYCVLRFLKVSEQSITAVSIYTPQHTTHNGCVCCLRVPDP
jgi:hypothetical protein